MIKAKLIEQIFTAAFIERWNDYPRMMSLVELDKQAHKFIIAYFLARSEGMDFDEIIEAGIFEFFRRVILTDIRPDVFHSSIEKKSTQLNEWVISQLETAFLDINDGKFFAKFKNYFLDKNTHKKARFILKAASYLSTRWEFNIIYQNSQFLSDIDEVKKAVDLESEDYYELLGVRKILANQKLAKIVDLSGRLRFQKRWARTSRIPETSVLGHMLIVALFSYFYSLKINACKKRLEYNFLCSLFHDLPEALTRDIISPVKYSISGLDDLINEFEMNQINEKIMPNIPLDIKDEFAYILGICEDKKDEFSNRIYEKDLKIVDTLQPYNEDRFRAIDGVALKQCDKFAAFVEAVISMGYGMRNKELSLGAENILKSFKERGKINGVDFFELALNTKEYFLKD